VYALGGITSGVKARLIDSQSVFHRRLRASNVTGFVSALIVTDSTS